MLVTKVPVSIKGPQLLHGYYGGNSDYPTHTNAYLATHSSGQYSSKFRKRMLICDSGYQGDSTVKAHVGINKHFTVTL